jgi:hypothetical protein
MDLFLEVCCMGISRWVNVNKRQEVVERKRKKRKEDKRTADRELLAALTAAMVTVDPGAMLLESRDRDGEALKEVEIHMVRFGKRILLFVDHDRRDGVPLEVERDLSVSDLVAVAGATRDNALGFHLRGCASNELAGMVKVKPKKTRRRDRSYFTRRIDFAAMKPVNLARRIAAAQ